MPQTTLSEIAQAINAAQRIAIATHISPDPDAIGSALGLTHVLTALGKQVVPLCDDAVPATLDFLPGVDWMRRELPEDFNPQLFISLDASDTERLGTAATFVAEGELPVLNIDHHITNLNFGSVNLIDATCPAAAELLISVVDALGVTLSPEAATCFAAGLVGDTRAFSIPAVTPQTMRVAARLIEAGADMSDIIDRLMNRRSLSSLRLWSIGLSHLKFDEGVIWLGLPLSERKENGLMTTDGHGLVNLLLSADEARIAAVFTERTDGQVDVSMRAKPGFDVATLALALGGGGHRLAAGCTLPGPLDDVMENVVKQLKVQTVEKSAAKEL